MIFMFCSPGAAGNACLNRKYCLYKSCLQHRAGWELLLLSNAHKEMGVGGKGALLPVWCPCCCSEGEAWGKGRGKRRSLNWWGVESVFDSVEIKGYVSTFPWILLRSLEPLRDSAACPGTTNCRIEPSWLYLNLSLWWLLLFLKLHHVSRNLVFLLNLYFVWSWIQKRAC